MYPPFTTATTFVPSAEVAIPDQFRAPADVAEVHVAALADSTPVVTPTTNGINTRERNRERNFERGRLRETNNWNFSPLFAGVRFTLSKVF